MIHWSVWKRERESRFSAVKKTRPPSEGGFVVVSRTRKREIDRNERSEELREGDISDARRRRCHHARDNNERGRRYVVSDNTFRFGICVACFLFFRVRARDELELISFSFAS